MTEATDEYAYTRLRLATGEVNHWIGKPGEKPQSISKEPFIMLHQAANRLIAMNYDLQGFDLRLYIFLTSILETDNWIDVHHGRIARQMSTEKHQIKRPQVTTSLGKLVTAGLILKGQERTYRLHPGVGWKGDRQSQAKAVEDVAKNHLTLVRP